MPSWRKVRPTVLATLERSESTSRWFSGKDVRPSALVLHFRRIRRSLDDLFNGKPCCLKVTLDFGRLKKEKIHRDPMTPQFFLVSRSFAHVECKEKLPARLYYSRHFPEDRGQKFSGNIHDGVEGDDRSERFIAKVQSHHVSFTEVDVWIQPSSLLQHAGREI